MKTILLQGTVEVRVIHKDKGVIRYTQERNQLTQALRTKIFEGILNGSYTPKPITKIAIGKGTTSPTETDSSLEDEVITKNLDSVEVLNNRERRLIFEPLDYEEGNGNTLTELGLKDEDDVLLARKVESAPIAKTNLIKVEYSWVISFL